MRDLKARNSKEITHAISNLKVSYKRQLPYLGYLPEEPVRVEQDLVKLLTSILPGIHHCTRTSYGISKEYYWSKILKLGSTR